MEVYFSKSREYVLLLERNKSTVEIIKRHRGRRRIVSLENAEFQRGFSKAHLEPYEVSRIWLDSTFPMTPQVKEILEAI